MTTTYTYGSYTYGRPTVVFDYQGAVCTVGKYCSIAEDVTIFLGGEHHIDTVASYPFCELGVGAALVNGFSKGDVVIGSDVWIGQGAVILSGVTIGDGAVIGAAAVVASDVPPYAVMIGNPARILRYRFSEPQIAELLEVRWWDWERQRIEACAHLLSGPVDAFLESLR